MELHDSIGRKKHERKDTFMEESWRSSIPSVEGQREGRGCVAPRAVRKIKFGEKGPHRECHIFITVAHFV